MTEQQFHFLGVMASPFGRVLHPLPFVTSCSSDSWVAVKSHMETLYGISSDNPQPVRLLWTVEVSRAPTKLSQHRDSLSSGDQVRPCLYRAESPRSFAGSPVSWLVLFPPMKAEGGRGGTSWCPTFHCDRARAQIQAAWPLVMC